MDVFGAQGGAPAAGVSTQITGLGLASSPEEPAGIAIDDACYYHVPSLSGASCEAFDHSNGDLYVAEGPKGAVGKYELNPQSDVYRLVGTLPAPGYPMGVAVDTDGDVYVASYNEEAISEFNTSGVEVGSIAQEAVGNPAYVAVGAPGVVYVGNYRGGVAKLEVSSGDVVEDEELLAPAGRAVTVDSAGNVFVVEGGHVAVYKPSGVLEEEFGSDEFEESKGVAVNQRSGNVYVSNPHEKNLEVFGPLRAAPSVTIKPVTAILQNSATFNGEVDPHEAETVYHFEYSTDGVKWTALAERSAGEGAGEVPVSETVNGLAGNTTYRVRLVAVSSGGSITSATEETFPTLAGPPRVLDTAATDVSAGEATLRAAIDPENEPATSYRFEYGPTAAYGASVPAGEGHLLGGATSEVSEALTGLAPDSTYHFRLVASNGAGSPATTADQTFTTYPSSPAPSGCPNEQVRSESDINPDTEMPFSLGLPECRAYEMVTPLLKNGSPISSSVAVLGIGSIGSVARVGSEGSTVLIKSKGIWPGGEQSGDDNLLNAGAKEGIQYKITRGESGWEFKPEDPPGLREFVSSLLPNPADMSTNGIWAGSGAAPAEENIGGLDPNFYLLESDGALAEVGPTVPLADHNYNFGHELETGPGGIAAVGGSVDLSRVLFSVAGFRWPFDQTKLNLGNSWPEEGVASLYEYVGSGHSGAGSDVPTLVGVDNTGALISQCGTEAGGYEGEGASKRSDETGEVEARSISAGGSSVFFTARAPESKCEGHTGVQGTGPAVNEVFARVGEPGAGVGVGSAVTVNVAGASAAACEVSDSCGVTQAVKYQGASTDGSKVFFTSEQPLVAGDTDSTNSLYECRLPGDAGAPLGRVTPVNPCPELVRLSVPVSGAGAEVQSVAAVSQDGSHVYFVAKGVLSGANAEQNSPAEGQDNLYVWEAPSLGHPQRTVFIATLSAAAFKLGEAQATPDGDSLVFTSSADLTLDDTSTVAQVFLYEAQHEALIRVPRGQDAFNDDGNTTTDPASLTSGVISVDEADLGEGRRVISEDGSVVVFESNAALTPQVHGGSRNVYLWRGGEVYLISDGTPAGSDGGSAAGLVGIDASGQNVFFTTEAPLVGQDSDELSDLYDARIDGGFPAPRVNECVGEGCQGAPPAQLPALSPGSLSPSASGNLAPTLKSTSAPKPLPKALTRAQKLLGALRACGRDRAKKKRARCESLARKRYGAKTKSKAKTKGKAKAKAKRKTGKSAGRGGK